jgi:hypothetical protein
VAWRAVADCLSRPRLHGQSASGNSGLDRYAEGSSQISDTTAGPRLVRTVGRRSQGITVSSWPRPGRSHGHRETTVPQRQSSPTPRASRPLCITCPGTGLGDNEGYVCAFVISHGRRAAHDVGGPHDDAHLPRPHRRPTIIHPGGPSGRGHHQVHHRPPGPPFTPDSTRSIPTRTRPFTPRTDRSRQPPPRV